MVVIYFVIFSLIGGMFAKEESAVFEQAMLELQASGAVTPEEQFAIMAETGNPYAKAVAIPIAFLSMISTMLGAFLINLILKQDAHENQYGHPPAA